MVSFKIEDVNIIGYIESYKLSENDVDSPDAGRTLDAIMHRGKVASKRKAEIKLIPMTSALKEAIFQRLRREYVHVDYENDKSGEMWSCDMYNSTRSGEVACINSDGIEIWDSVSFNLIER